MNWGLSVAARIKDAFPDIALVERPCVLRDKIKDPNWLAGFAEGEGCFMLARRP